MRPHTHTLSLSIGREAFHELGLPDSESEVEIEVTSSDLAEGWRELLSRLPSDTYAALLEAMFP